MKTGFRSSFVVVMVALVAVVALAPVAGADVPPSEKIYSRSQTWTCPGLGEFEALYSPWGNNPAVKWLSPDGTRNDAVQLTVVWGDITLTFGDEVFHFVGPDNPPERVGQQQYRCTVYGVSEDGRDSIAGTAIIAVIPRA